MPYVPTEDRPSLDKKVFALADSMSEKLIELNATAAVSEQYISVFEYIADRIIGREKNDYSDCIHENHVYDKSVELADEIFDVASEYGYQGAWQGELNFSVTRLIQAVPLMMVDKKAWEEPFRYWLYSQTVGALTRTASRIDMKSGNNWIANGLVGVFEDIRDEYKDRVNRAYEAVQILESGDCYEMSPYRSAVVPLEVDGMKGYIELMLPKQKPEMPWKD